MVSRRAGPRPVSVVGQSFGVREADHVNAVPIDRDYAALVPLPGCIGFSIFVVWLGGVIGFPVLTENNPIGRSDPWDPVAKDRHAFPIAIVAHPLGSDDNGAADRSVRRQEQLDDTAAARMPTTQEQLERRAFARAWIGCWSFADILNGWRPVRCSGRGRCSRGGRRYHRVGRAHGRLRIGDKVAASFQQHDSLFAFRRINGAVKCKQQPFFRAVLTALGAIFGYKVIERTRLALRMCGHRHSGGGERNGPDEQSEQMHFFSPFKTACEGRPQHPMPASPACPAATSDRQKIPDPPNWD